MYGGQKVEQNFATFLSLCHTSINEQKSIKEKVTKKTKKFQKNLKRILTKENEIATTFLVLEISGILFSMIKSSRIKYLLE
jgi:hypothetical protein